MFELGKKAMIVAIRIGDYTTIKVEKESMISLNHQ